MITDLALPGLLDTARTAHRGVGAFNVVLLEHAEAIVAGAETAGLPVVLQISENCAHYHGGLAPITRATLALARASDVEVLVHLDHIEDTALIEEGLALGVDSVMYDGSKLPWEANVAATRAMAERCHDVGVAATRSIAERCHDVGVAVEAELGEVGGKDGVHAPGARTDPDEAAAFVAATGIDALAVAVGTSHAMQTRDAAVDRSLVSRLRTAVPVPLVLHGSSGLSDEELRGAVHAGMTKVNISTHLNGMFTRAVRQVLDERPDVVDPRKYVAAGRDAIAAETTRLLTLLAG